MEDLTWLGWHKICADWLDIDLFTWLTCAAPLLIGHCPILTGKKGTENPLKESSTVAILFFFALSFEISFLCWFIHFFLWNLKLLVNLKQYQKNWRRLKANLSWILKPMFRFCFQFRIFFFVGLSSRVSFIVGDSSTIYRWFVINGVVVRRFFFKICKRSYETAKRHLIFYCYYSIHLHSSSALSFDHPSGRAIANWHLQSIHIYWNEMQFDWNLYSAAALVSSWYISNGRSTAGSDQSSFDR